MIILKRKNLIITLSTVIILLFAFSFKIANKKEILPTVSLPVSRKTIVIDAGHGIPDERC